MVEVMDDRTALEVQAIENLQREDLNPIEEAQGYKQLQDAGYSIEDLIKKTGKSRSRVFERLRLLKLSADIQKSVLAGELDLSRASLIGQVADPKSQAELKVKAVSYGWAHRGIKETIEREYQRNLQGAVFDQKTEFLTPGVKACTDCPKRSGNILTFEGSPNVCTDVKCFEAKSKAGMEIKVKGVEAKGQKVVRGDWSKTHVELAARDYDLGYDEKLARWKTWEEAIGKAKYTPLLAVKANELVKVLPKDEARKLAKVKEQSVSGGGSRRTSEEIAKEKENTEIRKEAEKRYIEKLGPTIMKAVGTEKGLREAIETVIDLMDMNVGARWEEVAKQWKLPKTDKATVAQLVTGLVGMNALDGDESLYYDWPTDGAFGLKLKTFEDEVKKEREAAAKTQQQTLKGMDPKAGSTKKAAAKGKGKAVAK
jgi:ParB-like chromosome segregation protein Spo0J